MTIRPCEPADVAEIGAVINDAASAYRGVIPADRWHDPYMPNDELRQEIAEGVRFWACVEEGHLLAVMGLQHVGGVALIRHAYTRTANQATGLGAALLERLRAETDRPMLVGTWNAAVWAIRFYERHGFRLVPKPVKDELLRQYWTVPERQMETSVVLGDARWWASHAPAILASKNADRRAPC